MRVGFDVSQTGSGKAGCGYFAHGMIEGLLEPGAAHQYSLYPSFGDFFFDAQMPVVNPYRGRDVQYGPRHLTRESSARFWNRPDLDSALGNLDIVHANNFWCPRQLVHARLVFTLYDLGFVIDPSWTTETNRVGCFDGVFGASVFADWIVAISRASRRHFLEVFPYFPADRIQVIYPCSRFADTDNPGRRPKALRQVAEGGFWLNVGTIEPRKNQRLLADAYARHLALGRAPKHLVFAGGSGWLMENFQSHLVDLGIAEQVLFTGYVSDDELIWLYRNCYANVYPSSFEGFGLPVLEGMTFGAATLASNSTSIPEVADDAAILTDPDDVEALVEAMGRLEGDPALREQLRQRARIQAARFSWKHSASALLGLYEEAVHVPKRRQPS